MRLRIRMRMRVAMRIPLLVIRVALAGTHVNLYLALLVLDGNLLLRLNRGVRGGVVLVVALGLLVGSKRGVHEGLGGVHCS